MRAILVLMMLAVQHSAALAADEPVRFGVVTVERGVACLRGASSEPGRRVLLIEPEAPQKSYQAVVAGSSRCPSSDGQRRVALSWAEAAGHDAPLIAVMGSFGNVATSRDQVVVSSPVLHEKLHFRTCASADGLHLTVWGGVPLRSRRLWHAYVYLNQDLEADCTTAETR